MRAEEKELEGPDLERAQGLKTEIEQGEDELPVLASEEVHDAELAHRGRLFDAIRLILAREQVTVSLLQLPQRETHALEFLQTAVSGRDVHLGRFVYAEDRGSMLEQALAVLQQNLTHGSPAELAELHGKFDGMSSQIAELRAELHNLDEAQDDQFEQRHHEATSTATEAADKPELDESVTGFIASALEALAGVAGIDAAGMRVSTLGGSERPEKPRAPTTLAGAEPVAVAKPASSLDGPEPKIERLPTTLAGPDRTEPPKPASTLAGPELPEVPKRASTLSEPERSASPSIPPPLRRSSPSIPIADVPKGKK